MSLFNLLGSLVEELSQVLVLATDTLGYLDYDGSALQVEFFAFTKVEVFPPVHIADEIPSFIVDHDALVERMKFQATVLPSFLFSFQIVGEETYIFQHWGGNRENRAHLAILVAVTAGERHGDQDDSRGQSQ